MTTKNTDETPSKIAPSGREQRIVSLDYQEAGLQYLCPCVGVIFTPEQNSRFDHLREISKESAAKYAAGLISVSTGVRCVTVNCEDCGGNGLLAND